MPYDLQTPFGTTPGLVSPYEQLQAQTMARMRSQAASDDAQSAQMRVLKQAMGGASEGNDPFFSETGPFGIAPKQTGAIDLTKHNTEVDQRQQQTAGYRDLLDLQKPPDYLTATDHGDQARAQHGLDMGQLDIEGQAQGALRDALKGMMPGGSAAGPMNPNLPAGGANPNALVGGASGGPDVNALVGGGGGSSMPGGGGTDDSRLLNLAILGGLSKGGQMPDIGGILNRRGELSMKRDEHDLAMQSGRLALAERMREIEKAHADEDAMKGDPSSVTAKYPEITAPLAKAAADFVTQDTKMVGWDPTDSDIDNMVQERDRAARGLATRGLSPAQAQAEANRAIVMSLGANRNDLNSGATRKMLARLGIAAGAADAAPAPAAAAGPTAYNPFAVAPQVAASLYPRGALGAAR